MSKVWLLLFSIRSVSNDTYVMLQHQQHITITFIENNIIHLLTFVYSSVIYIQRRDLWVSMMSLFELHPYWLVMRDFNVVLGAHETMGLSCGILSVKKFSTKVFFFFNNLVDIDTK